MRLEDLAIGIIRDSQEQCTKECKTIGEWKKYWLAFGKKYELTQQEALKVAQDRL